jgi:ArsR family transcriptional regulator
MSLRDSCEEHFVDLSKVIRVRENLISSNSAHELADIFKVLGDPTRIKIISALAQEELCVCDLANLLGMEISAVSHQLRILRAHHLVKYRKLGKFAYYSLDDEHIFTLFEQGLDHVGEGSKERVPAGEKVGQE